MKTTKFFFLFVPILLLSCKDDVESLLSAQQNAAIEDQSVTEAYFNEAGDLTTKAFNTPSSDQISGGRTRATITIEVEGDTRFTGSIVTLVTDESSTPLSPKGNITIDFGEGQTDSKGTVRKGKILVAYSGLRFVPNSYTITTFEDYFVNGVKIDGKRTITSTSLTASPALKVTFTVADEDGIATFPDETTITRNASHVHTITFGNTIGGTTWEVQGQASGKTRTDSDYTFVINRALLFKTECAFNGIALPAEGEALFTVDNLPFVINYGDAGAGCNNTVTITFNSQSADIVVAG